MLGGPKSVLIFDESAFAKKGKASAGVARQWNGRLGKADNCQVGVFASLCQGEMASLVDARLYLPEHWKNKPERCEKAAIPKEAQCYQSKSALALVMLKVALQLGIRFGYVGIDGGYGKEPAFLRHIDNLGCTFVTDVHSKQLYLENDWDIPKGFIDKNQKAPLNFTRQEWQQALRTGQNPKAIKAALQDSWAISDSRKAF